ncbi:hypothetical protein [Pyruvatibacter sp.]|uniref:hypothetical protein n=1 Tax=Pyruvatibacter sp. TaxID=1981328 RepID=UPI0032EADE8A
MTVVPEAQLQSYVVGLAREAFPHVKAESFKVEKRLKLKLGHTDNDYDGTAAWEAEGRADLLLLYDGDPLAVVELKRADKALMAQDLKQGQSYAAVLTPRPPLVIVSNGNETWVRQVDSGKELPLGLDGAATIEKVFANIGKLAAADNSWAIEVLMGPETSVWVEAVRQRTDKLIDRMTGEPGDTFKPFCEELLFHRRATDEIIAQFDSATKAVIVEGPPLAGKSNVLRELAVATRCSPDWGIFMVNGATAGPGLFQRLANILGAALEWKLEADDVRTWLRRMSQSTRKPALVLAVDGLKPGSPVAHDFEELAETGFGEGLRLVGCTECADDILLDGTGRGQTAVSSIAKVVQVDTLDDDEFSAIREHLSRNRIFFYPGAELSDEYRAAWVLRSVLAGGALPEKENVAAAIPATMGLRLVQSARERFDPLHDVARRHRLIVRDALCDEEAPNPEVTLAGTNAFVIRRDALSSDGEDAAVKLQEEGWVGFYRHSTGKDLVAFRVPELFMSELARELADTIEVALNAEPDEAWRVLIQQASRFFLGDIVGAQALCDLGRKRNGLPLGLMGSLMNDRPCVESLFGKTIGIQMADGTVRDLHFNEDGEVAALDVYGNVVGDYTPLSDDDDFGVAYGNMMSWLILSQLASVRTAFGETIEERLDIEVMLHVGRARMPLVRGGNMANLKAHSIANLGNAGSVLSAEHALAEPLTSAIHKLLHEEWRDLDFFFLRLVEADSLPATVRVHHALNSLKGSVVPGLENWAQGKMTSTVRPLLQKQMARDKA